MIARLQPEGRGRDVWEALVIVASIIGTAVAMVYSVYDLSGSGPKIGFVDFIMRWVTELVVSALVLALALFILVTRVRNGLRRSIK